MDIIRYNNGIPVTLDDLKNEQFDNQSVVSMLRCLNEECDDNQMIRIS